MGSISTLKLKKKDGFDPVKFASEFEETYESKAGFTQKNTFSPSTLGYGHGNCARYWFIAFNGADFKDTAKPQAKAAMENGNFVHDRLQERMSKMHKSYKVIAHEVETTYDNPPIRGFLDTLIQDMDNDQIVPIEIKSAKDAQHNIKAISKEPSDNHRIQLLTYMKIWGYKEGCFMYENKDDQTLVFIPIQMDAKNQELIEYVFDWLRGVKQLHIDETLPNRAFTKSTWACKGCPVFDACWKDMKDKEGEVQYPAMEVKI